MIGKDFEDGWMPKFYGATTIGERGQMVISVEARKDFQITPSSKLLVFGSHGGLMVVKAEHITGFLTKATEMLRALEKGAQESETHPSN